MPKFGQRGVVQGLTDTLTNPMRVPWGLPRNLDVDVVIGAAEKVNFGGAKDTEVLLDTCLDDEDILSCVF